jgi:hypothetical protein
MPGFSFLNFLTIFFIHSCTDGHLGQFYNLAIVNSVANKHGHTGVSVVKLTFILLGICPEVVLLGHMGLLFLLF